MGFEVEEREKQNVYVNRILKKAKERLNALIYCGVINKTNTVELNMRLINAIVLPVLYYGAEILFYNETNLKKMEKFANLCRKTAAGCCKKVCNDTISGDLGEMSVRNRMLMLKIRYYFNITNDHDRLVSRIMKSLDNWKKNKLNLKVEFFLEKMKKILSDLQIDIEEFINTEIEKRKEKILMVILNKEENEWIQRMRSNSKLIFYAHIKKTFDKENFIKSKDRNKVNLKLKLRSGTLDLEIENGRAKGIPNSERICKLCEKEVEDEFHFISECEKLEDVRREAKIKLEEIAPDMTTDNSTEGRSNFFWVVFGSFNIRKIDNWALNTLAKLYYLRGSLLLKEALICLK